MRITADIFDKEPFVMDKVFHMLSSEVPEPEKLPDEQPKLKLQPESNWFFYKHDGEKSTQLDDIFGPETRTRNFLQHNKKLLEVIQNFKKLRLTDKRLPLTESKLNLLEAASTSKSMDIATGDGDVSATNSNVSSSWLVQYLAKMKQEIKKEILQELLHAPQNEMFCFKTGASNTNKIEENQLPFQGEVIHSGIFCDNCDQLIHGIRYKCGNCSDFDLCQECESLPNIHDKYHIFLKIRYPFALKLYQKQKMLELLNPTTGKLYMTSRNRQAKKLYEAKFVCDETVPDSTVLPPSTKFVKSWKVVNSGTRVWTHATKLQLIQGSPDLVPSSEHVDVPHLKPGEEGIVSVLFTSPSSPGVYRCHWNFCHKSRPFGDIVWCHIVVKSPATDGNKIENVNPEKSKTPNINISVDKVAENKQNEASCIAQVLTAVKKEHERGNLVPRKLVVTSHTATPNNTPFDLTPPKSPDHHEISAKVQEITTTSTPISTQTRDSDEDDDECSIVSIGSSESDTEFVVIPMPKCFNLSESFVSQHIPLWVQHCQDESDNLQKIVNMIPTEKQPVAAKSGSVQPQTSAKKISTSETVSQETGVPELSENACEQTILEVSESQKDNVKTNYVTLVADGSSSEVSIIESEENSPVAECATQTIGTINISLSSGGISSMPEVDKLEVHLNNNPLNDQVEQTNEEEIVETTFPKFPIEGITSTYDPSPTSIDDRNVQVLPERLVTGALSAAASVYNTARAVISTMQQPRNEETCLSQQIQTTPQPLDPMDQLIEMGFCHRQLNEQLLKKHKGDVALVVAELLFKVNASNTGQSPCFDFD